MHSWAEEELKDTGLPDQRLNRRLIKIVAQAVQQPYYVRGLKVHSSLIVRLFEKVKE